MGEYIENDATASDASFNILTPNAMLGYGYESDHFWYGVAKYRPAAIIVDSGSTDAGPYKLGMGKMTCGRGSYLRDLETILTAAYHFKVKVLVSSAGGDGSNQHVEEMYGMIEEISKKCGFSFNVATISTDLKRDEIKSRISAGKVSPCGPLDNLTKEDVDSAVEIVAQMGAEP